MVNKKGLEKLFIRKLTVADEFSYLQACESFNQTNDSAFEFDISPRKEHPDMVWAQVIDLLEAQEQGKQLPDGWVPHCYLVAEIDGRIIGRCSVRFGLNEHLRKVGGHVGYGILPQYRGLGYATQMLIHSLEILKEKNINSVLVTCDEDNKASARVIEKCGGTFESLYSDESEVPKRRYWIDF